MKLKRWLEITLIIIACISFIAMFFTENIILGIGLYLNFIFLIGIVGEYGRLEDKLIGKLEEFMHR